MPSTNFGNALLAVLLFATLSPGAAVAQQPDPLALLRGVQQSRVGLHGKLRVSAVLREFPIEVEIDFNRDRRRFVQRQSVFTISGADADEKRRKLELLKNDHAAGVRAGLGTQVIASIRSAFNGEQLADFTEQTGAYIRVRERGDLSYCFDPRVLGISRSNSQRDTLDDALGIGLPTTATLVGRERVAGHDTWHVHLTHRGRVVEDLWIENAEGFRVYRYEYAVLADGSLIKTVVASDYGPGPELPPLPVLVKTEEANGGTVNRTETLTVTKSDYSFEPDPSVFGLAGLDMPPATLVIDDRISRVVGYWNGVDLSETAEQALQATAVNLRAEVEPPRRRWVLPAAVVAGVALVAAALYARRRVQTRPGG